jgi:hypothetical protein
VVSAPTRFDRTASSDIGGAETASEAQISLCRRAATIEVQLEAMEGQLSLGNDAAVDLDLYNRLAGNLRRILESLGLRRVARTISLRQYLDAKATPK